MRLPDFLELGNRSPALPFLLIGGYAVGAYGHTRATFDIDFLTDKALAENWMERASASGLKLQRRSESFAQFSQEHGEGFDLMFVPSATFSQLWAASEEKQFGDYTAKVPSLEHLIALKLHVLKQGLPHRTSKDVEDVEMLIRRNNVNIEEPVFSALFLKYGTREIYETIQGILRHPEEDRGS